MSKLFQIHEEDLGELERTLPQLAEVLSLSPDLPNRTRVQLRRVQAILSNVRWNYGPPNSMRIVSTDDEPAGA